jgi:SAM-dependent methyltransferase
VSLHSLLSEPRVRFVDVDSQALLDAHRDILAGKPMLRGVFREFYDTCMALDRRYFSGQGLRIEIGAGVSLFKHYHPEVIATDIKASPHLDEVVDALSMPYPAESIRAIFAINCFHHLPSPDRFFQELERVLVPGGGCVLIDPYFGPLARWVYPRLFDTERFDMCQVTWDPASKTMGTMSGANQALSYVVFARDRTIFRDRHPSLELVGMKPLPNYLRYLFSGGLNFRRLLPTAAIEVLRIVEGAMKPLARAFGLHQVIVIRKRPSN